MKTNCPKCHKGIMKMGWALVLHWLGYARGKTLHSGNATHVVLTLVRKCSACGHSYTE